jgi:hypothetical protein
MERLQFKRIFSNERADSIVFDDDILGYDAV